MTDLRRLLLGKNGLRAAAVGSLVFCGLSAQAQFAGTMGFGFWRAPMSQFIGWIGQIATSPTGGAAGCNGASGFTPGWCLGGTAQVGNGNGGLNLPTSVAIDNSGDMYVADLSNNRVSKYNLITNTYVGSIGNTSASTGTCPSSGAATGWCTGGTFAAGAADGMLHSPRSLFVDNTNNLLYVTDSLNYRISKFNLASGAFVGSIGNTSASTGTCPSSGAATGWCTGGTFATGAGDGMLNNPSAVFGDPTNNALYVTDAGNNRISKYTLSTGAFVGAIGKTTASSGTCPSSGATTSWCTGGTFASGAGDGMLSSPYGLFADSSGNFLYVADSTNNRISKYTLSTGAFVGAIGKTTASSGTCPSSGATTSWCTGGTFASGAGDGMLSSPYGLFADSSGNFLYIADTANNRISKYTLSTGAFVGAIGKTTASSGTCPSSGIAVSWCTGGTFASGTGDATMNSPFAITVDVSSGKIYVADYNNYRIDLFKP